MSFSTDVKNEIAGSMPNARHCRIAELAAIVNICGTFDRDEERLEVASENRQVTDRYLQLIKKLFSLEPNFTIEEKNGRKRNIVTLAKEEAQKVLLTAKADIDRNLAIDDIVIQQTCCKRAYMRGAFLAGGSVSDPQKDYHFEIVTDREADAQIIAGVLYFFDIDAKIIPRKNNFVVYLKDSEHIVDALNVMEAHVALMELENIRILKDMRNNLNRRINCEAANIGKTVAASNRQTEDIVYIRDNYGFDGLTAELKETALLRLEHPDLSLNELGKMHTKPVSRSGVNHRLGRLSDMAERLRSGKPI